MKKIFTSIAMLGLSAACLVMLTGCPPAEKWEEWHVENGTGQDLILKTPIRSIDIVINGRMLLASFASLTPPGFEEMYTRYTTVEFSWVEVYSTDGVLLKRWELSEKDEPGKQFFNASSWSRRNAPDFWVFKITPEDIAPTP